MQKRMGKNFVTSRSMLKVENLQIWKVSNSVGGRGRLSDTEINKVQAYYGNASEIKKDTMDCKLWRHQ